MCAVWSKAAADYPVTEKALENIWKCQRARGISWRAATDRFRCETERIARPTSADDSFPENITYQSQCDAQCRVHAPPARVDLHQKLLSGFCRVVSHHGKITDVIQSDIVIACECFNDKRQRMTTFAFLTAASYRSGIQKPDQVYVLASPVEAENNVARTIESRFNCVLQLSTRPFVQMKKHYLPPQPAAVGPLEMRTADEMAKEILDMDGASRAESVVLTKLCYEDLSTSIVRVTGIDGSMPAVVIRSSSVMPEEPDAVEDQGSDSDHHQGEDDPGHGAPADGEGGGEDSLEMDLTALLSDGVLGEPKRRVRRRADAAQHVVSEGAARAEAEDLLGDPEMQAILGVDEIESLRAALKLCEDAHAQSHLAPTTPAGAGAGGIGTDSETEIENEVEMHAPAPDADAVAAERPKAQKRKEHPGEAGTGQAEESDSGRLETESYLIPPEAAPASSSSSSSSHATGQAAAAVAILRTESDGSQIRVVYEKRGLEICRVEHVKSQTNETKILGSIKQMVNRSNGRESLQAVCRQHSSCICWLSNTQHSDLLLGWLASASTEDVSSHQQLAAVLKRSVGMKVRGPN